MKIYVKEPGKPALRLIIPTSMLTGRLVMWIVKKAVIENFKDRMKPGALAAIDQLELSEYAGRIKAMKKMYPKLYLVDIESNDGTSVKIRL